MMIGIIGAMEEEIDNLIKEMKSIEINPVGLFDFITGTIGTEKIVLLKCGIGKVNAAIGCTLMAHIYSPKVIINSGSSGGIKPWLKIGDIALATGFIYHDVDVSAFRYKLGQIPGMPEVINTAASLTEIAERSIISLVNANKLPHDIQSYKGIIGSGDIFMSDMEKIEKLRYNFPDIIAVEMEGAAIAHCCSLLSIPMVSIRSISDVAGVESNMTFDKFLPVAAMNSSQVVLEIIRRLNNDDSEL